jgi:hypothetical protein
MGPSLLSEQGGCEGLAGKEQHPCYLSAFVHRQRLGINCRMRTPPQCQFPANREKNREFRRIGPFDAILKADKFVNSETCIKIP